VDTVHADGPEFVVIDLFAHTGYGRLSMRDTLDFGSIDVGSCFDTILPLTNTGTEPLTIKAFPGLSTEFTVVTT
jgi:hypothetical protein